MTNTTQHIFLHFVQMFWKDFQWPSVNIFCVGVFHLQHRQTTSHICKCQNLPNRSFYKYLQRLFVGSFWQQIVDKVIAKNWQVLLPICRVEDFVIWRASSTQGKHEKGLCNAFCQSIIYILNATIWKLDQGTLGMSDPLKVGH